MQTSTVTAVEHASVINEWERGRGGKAVAKKGVVFAIRQTPEQGSAYFFKLLMRGIRQVVLVLCGAHSWQTGVRHPRQDNNQPMIGLVENHAALANAAAESAWCSTAKPDAIVWPAYM